MPRRGETNLNPEAIETAIRRYQAGESLRPIAESLHVAPRTLQAALCAAGIPLRSKSDTCRLRALAQHGSDLRAMSAEALAAQYWGAEKPSLATLAARHGVSVKHLTAVLTDRGIRIRTAAEQLAIDGRKGRRRGCGGKPRGGGGVDWSRPDLRQRMWAGMAKRGKNRRWRKNAGLAHRRTEARVCQWCGATATRRPSEFRYPPETTYCSRPCASAAAGLRRRDPLAPRPLLAARIRAALGTRPATWENVEYAAVRVGALNCENEMWDVIEHP